MVLVGSFSLVFTSSSASLGSFQGGFPGAELRARRGIDPIGFLLGLGCRQRAVWGQDQLPPPLLSTPPPWHHLHPGMQHSLVPLRAALRSCPLRPCAKRCCKGGSASLCPHLQHLGGEGGDLKRIWLPGDPKDLQNLLQYLIACSALCWGGVEADGCCCSSAPPSTLQLILGCSSCPELLLGGRKKEKESFSPHAVLGAP